MENKRKERSFEELNQDEHAQELNRDAIEKVNGGIFVPGEPDDDHQDSNGGGGATGGW